MMLWCFCHDKSRNVSVERQETEKPRLVRVSTPSGAEPTDKRVSLPQRVHSQLSMRETFGYRRDSETSRSRELVASCRNSWSKTGISPIKGILKSPKSKFPSEERPQETWTVCGPEETRIEVGNVPTASDANSRGYRRKGDTNINSDPTIIVEEVTIQKGDVVIVRQSADDRYSDSDSDSD